MKPLATRFFARDTITVAKELLGKYLVRETPKGRIVGRIVETEAYCENDPASHTSRGKTKRNAQMFGRPGTAYVYFTYGMYYCFNVVTRREGRGEAVLIRAVEPVEGIDIMKQNRKKDRLKELCSGPAKLAIAFDITTELNGACLTSGDLKVLSNASKKPAHVACSRIGISQGTDLQYRFCVKENPFVSVKPKF